MMTEDDDIDDSCFAFDGDYVIKVGVIGDSNVGKTCLLSRFVDNTFEENFIATIGVDYKSRIVQLDGKGIKMEMWDTAGQERFRSVTRFFYRGVYGCLIVYDVTNQESFDHVTYWLDHVDEYAPKNVCRLLVGNKCDLTSERAVDYSTGKAFADEHGIRFMETSAKDSSNVEQAFMQLVVQTRDTMYPADDHVPNLQLKPDNVVVERSGGCC